MERDSSSRSGIAHVVDSWWMRQAKDAEIFTFVSQSEFAGKPLQLNIADDQVGLARRAISKDGALHTGNDGLNVGFVEAKNCGAIKRYTIDELDEDILNIFERAVLIEVFAVDGGNDCYDRREEQKAAITFVGLDHEIFAAAQACGGAGLIDSAADYKCGIEMRRREDRSDQGCGGGFAMSAANRDAVFQAHQLSQHFGARNYRNLKFVSFDDFRIFRLNRRRCNNYMRASNVTGFVALVHCRAEVLQSLSDGGRLGVRTGDRVAECQQDFSDAAHADAADS